MNNTTVSLASISININRSYLTAQLIVGSSCFINSLCCILSLVTLSRGKCFHGRVFALLRLLFVNDGLVSIYVLFLQILHVYNNVNSIPELYTRFKCFWIAGEQFFFIPNNALITMMIAMDRLKFTLQPKKPIPEKLEFSCLTLFMLITPYVVSGLIYIWALLDYGDSSVIFLYCSSRVAAPNFWVWASVFVFTFVSLVMYLIMLVATHCKTTQIEPSPQTTTNNLSVIQAKMFKKLSRNLAITTIVYFFVGPLPNGLSTFFAGFMPDKLLSVGLYYTWLSFVEGSMYMFTLLFSVQFRQEMSKMFRVKQPQQ